MNQGWLFTPAHADGLGEPAAARWQCLRCKTEYEATGRGSPTAPVATPPARCLSPSCVAAN